MNIEQTPLNSARTVETGPSSFKKLLEPNKCTLFKISLFKQKKCIQKATGKNVWNNVLKQCIAHATLAHCIMSGTDKVIGL